MANEYLKGLIEQRDGHFGYIDEVLAAAATEGRELTPEEDADIEDRHARIDKLNAKVEELIGIEENKRKADESRARFADAVTPDTTRISVRKEPLTYERGDRNVSFFKDVVMRSLNGDEAAAERLNRHSKEVAVEAESRVRQGKVEFRDLTRVDTAGGGFVPPLHLVDQYVALARASRVTANLLNSRPLPPGTDSIVLPQVTTGTATAIQTADNAAVQETDIVEASISAPVRTIAGQQDIAIQLLDQSPIAFDEVIFSDLAADYATKLDVQVLSGSGASGQVTGIRTVSGINAVTYTDATPTVGELYPKLADAINQIHTGRFMPPDAIVMHPRRWAWLLASLDTSNRPLVVPEAQGPHNAMGTFGGVTSEGRVGSLLGIAVYVDPSIPTNLGGGTEDVILVLRTSDLWLFESSLRTRTLPDVGSATLTVRLQVYGYVAAQAARYPKSITTVAGTGLIAPTF